MKIGLKRIFDLLWMIDNTWRTKQILHAIEQLLPTGLMNKQRQQVGLCNGRSEITDVSHLKEQTMLNVQLFIDNLWIQVDKVVEKHVDGTAVIVNLENSVQIRVSVISFHCIVFHRRILFGFIYNWCIFVF